VKKGGRTPQVDSMDAQRKPSEGLLNMKWKMDGGEEEQGGGA